MDFELLAHVIGKPVLFSMTLGFVIMFILNIVEVGNDHQ